jgi:hypothetical protein
MNALTCEQVEQQLDLLAAGECDLPTRRALERHLEDCASCSASYRERQLLQGMLDLHYNETSRLQRLHERIEEADRPVLRFRPRVLPFVKRFASLAALLLVAVGLMLAFPHSEMGQPEVQMGAAVVSSVGGAEAMKVAPAVRVVADTQAQERITLPASQSGPGFRKELMEAKHNEKVIAPPALGLAVEVKNTRSRPVQVQFDNDTELLLDVTGPGVVRLPAPPGTEPRFLLPRTLRLLLDEGCEGFTLTIDRLESGSRRHLEYVYLTEPGEYTLTVRLRVRIDNRLEVLTKGPIRVRVTDGRP